MSFQLIHIGILSFGLLVSSCSVMTNKFDSLKLECGISAISPNQTLVKILDTQGSELSFAEKSSLQGRSLSIDGEARALVFSEAGCTVVDSKAELLQVIARSADKISQFSSPVANKGSQFSTIKLSLAEAPDFALSCPNGGIFVNDSLGFPIDNRSAADLTFVEAELFAKSKKTQIKSLLYKKPYGSKAWDSGRMLSMASIEEGEYELLLEAKQTVQSFDESLKLMQGQQTCPLYVIHSLPHISQKLGINESDRLRFQSADPILWFSDGAASQLNVCREFRASSEDELPEATCKAMADCLDAENFKNSTGLVAEGKGVYDYLYFASDRAGNRSDVQCKRVVISEKKPEISLSWENSKWNIPHSAIDRAYRTLKADIALFHPQLSKGAMLPKLECKVDFLMEGVSELAGSDARCLSGRCRGKTLETYQPCDESFEFSLVEYWQKYSARASQLKLSVRVKDVEGFASETSRMVWLHPSRFTAKTEMISETAVPRDPADPKFLESSDGTVYFASQKGFFKRDEYYGGTWDEVVLPENLGPLLLLSNRLKEIFLIAQVKVVEGEYVSYRLDQGKWVEVVNSPLLKLCFSKISEQGSAGFICQGNSVEGTDYSFLSLSAKGATEIEVPKLVDGLPCKTDFFTDIASGKDGILWKQCRQFILSKKGGEDWKVVHTFADAFTAEMRVDNLGRLWITDHGYLLGSTFHAIKFPKAKQSIESVQGEIYSFLDDGRIYYLDNLWLQDEARWASIFEKEKIATIVSLNPLANGSRLLFQSHNEALLSQSGQLSFVYTGAKVGVRSQPLRFLDSQGRVFSLDERDGEESYTVHVNQGNNPTVFGQEVSLGKKVDALDFRATNYSIDPDGSIVVYSKYEGNFVFKSNGDFRQTNLSSDEDAKASYPLISCNLADTVYYLEGIAAPTPELAAMIGDSSPVFLKITNSSQLILFKGESRAIIADELGLRETKLPFVAKATENERGYFCGVQLHDKILIWDRENYREFFAYSIPERSWAPVKQEDLGFNETSVYVGIKNSLGIVDRVLARAQSGSVFLLDAVGAVLGSWISEDNPVFDEIVEAEPGVFAGLSAGRILVGADSKWRQVLEGSVSAQGHLSVDKWGRLWVGGRSGLLIQINEAK